MAKSAARIGLLLLTASCVLRAQDAPSFNEKSDSLTIAPTDTLSVFRLLDSLMLLFEEEEHSVINFRLTYNSNVLAAGRTLGIDQFGLSPGVTWYHKSGLYADATLYWSADFNPTFYLTVLTAGYMHNFTPQLTATASYDRYEYRFDDNFVPFRNAVTLSLAYDFKYLSLQTDYAFFFGDEQVHRITPSVTGRLTKKDFLRLEQVSFNPGVYLLFGDATFTEIIMPQTALEWTLAILRMRRGLPWYTTRTHREFGLMNYALTLPVSVQKSNFTLLISYMYNIPRALPGETLDLSESSFIMAGLSYRLRLRKKQDW